ncbi:MAG: thioesterase family protein [Maricaulaceae bacterium]|jgi:acyl-CoA thioester hydrolase
MSERPAPPTRDQFRSLAPLRVRWSEVDPQGIVFNAHYLAWFDIAVTEHMRAIGFAYPDGFKPYGSDTFAVNAVLNYRASALFDDELDLGARISRIGRTSFAYAFGIFRGDALLVDGANTYVNGDIETHRPMPVPQEFIEKVEAFEAVAPERAAPAPT